MVLEAKFLTGLIPEYWEEVVHDEDIHYRIHVFGEKLSEKQWNKLVKNLTTEFGEDLKEIYTITPNGIEFDVFLRK